jgi:hypothetical protein
MTGYLEWLQKKRAPQEKRPWSGQKRREPVAEKPKDKPPYCRQDEILKIIRESEGLMACYSKLLAQPHPQANHDHFLDWLTYASDRYGRALILQGRCK